MHVTAYTPLGNTNPSFQSIDKLPPIQENPVVKQIAQKWGLSPANILISLQLSVCRTMVVCVDIQEGHSVLPKSVTPSRIVDNLKVVQLDKDDIAAIAEACKGKRQRYCDFSEISESH